MKNFTKNIVMPRPIHLAAAASKSVLNNLLGAIMELFDVSNAAEHIHRADLILPSSSRLDVQQTPQPGSTIPGQN